MRLAQIQMAVTADKAENLRHAEALLASVKGADMAVLPEMFCCPYDNGCFRAYGEAAGGAAYQMLSRAAAENHLWVVGGSIPELDGGRVYNTSYVFAPDGRCAARHRKMHLFDIDVDGGQRFRESDTLTAGDDVTVFDTPWGKMGLCICFDLRFQELSRLMTLAGAQVLLVPAAFNMTTGPAHWELLFRQRAVDNQLFTVGVSRPGRGGLLCGVGPLHRLRPVGRRPPPVRCRRGGGGDGAGHGAGVHSTQTTPHSVGTADGHL